jgi:phospholipid/cholesterol/gamma-HCH transport system substrate-binding protein
VLVGLFVTGAVGILSLGVMVIGDLTDAFTPKLTAFAVFDEVNGLKEGDKIWCAGLQVGTVRRLGFYDVARVEVELSIDANAAKFMHDDILAKVGSDGLIGNQIVVLYGGTLEAPLIADQQQLTSADTVSTETILQMLQANNTNLLAITTDLRVVSRRLAAGEGTVGRLLGDDALYADVDAAVGELGVAATNARALTASLADFSGHLDDPGTLPYDLVHDRGTWPAVADAVDGLRQTGSRLGGAVDGLAADLRGANAPLGLLLHDEVAGADLTATLGNLRGASGLLAEDLEALQHNFLLRGFFKQRERAAAKVAAEAERAARRTAREALKAGGEPG